MRPGSRRAVDGARLPAVTGAIRSSGWRARSRRAGPRPFMSGIARSRSAASCRAALDASCTAAPVRLPLSAADHIVPRQAEQLGRASRRCRRRRRPAGAAAPARPRTRGTDGGRGAAAAPPARLSRASASPPAARACSSAAAPAPLIAGLPERRGALGRRASSGRRWQRRRRVRQTERRAARRACASHASTPPGAMAPGAP